MIKYTSMLQKQEKVYELRTNSHIVTSYKSNICNNKVYIEKKLHGYSNE